MSGTNIKEQGFLSYDSWGSTQKGKNKQTVLANNQKIATEDIFTTCVETIYGITYLVMAPEHKFIENHHEKYDRTFATT